MRGLLVGILSFVMLLAGCSRSVDSRLVRVSQLADCNATDSALAVLGNVCRDSLNEHNRYYYDLMNIKARDKAYLDITTDTTITDIIAYFERRGSENELGEAYYYGGRVSREQGDAPQALDYYQKALDVLTSPEHMYRKGKIASQMGQIFLELYMFEQAKPKFQEAIAYQTVCADSVGLMYNYRDLANVNMHLNEKDSAINNSSKSLCLSQVLNPNSIDEIESRALLMSLYLQDDTIKAYNELKNIEHYIDTDLISDFVLVALANVYITQKKEYLAEKLANILINKSTHYSLKNGYAILADISRLKEDTKKCYEYTAKYKSYLDSIDNETSKNAVIFQDTHFNYLIKERKLNSFKSQKQQYYNISIILLSLVILIILISFKIYRIQKKQKVQLKEQKAELKNKQKEYISLQIEQLDIIRTLEKTISEQKLENVKITEELNNRKDNLIIKCDQKKKEIVASQIFQKFKAFINNDDCHLTSEDWDEFFKLIDIVYPNFKNKIYALNQHIKYNDYQICSLIKCGFSPSEIAKLTFREKNAITNYRTRLHLKLLGVTGSASSLDKFICSL